MKTILIVGGSGLIGQQLSKILTSSGYEVRVLSRTPGNRKLYFKWAPSEDYIDENAFNKIDILINLVGENVGAKRWTRKQKKKIVESRVNTTRLLGSYLGKQKIKPKLYIGASGTGYYGSKTSTKTFAENDPPGDDFLGLTCAKWEQAHQELAVYFERNIILRLGVVLARKSGSYKKMRLPVLFGIPYIGTGKQILPWVHISDVCNAIIYSIEKELPNNIFNIVAPVNNSYKEFSKELARVLKRKALLPLVPSFLVKLVFGEMSVIALKGNAISCKKIRSAGFKFKFESLKDALNDIEGKN